MTSLTREIRFNLVKPGSFDETINNSWGGWPSATAISPWLAIRCTVTGEIDTTSGYLCNIKLIDEAIRNKVIEPACQRYRDLTFETFTRFAFEQIQNEFPDNCHVEQLQLLATPTLRYTLHSTVTDMIQLSQQFEFSASHRLHNADLSDEQNLALFGKCNNPHGHGHNYVVTVTIEGSLDRNGTLVALDQFESLVKRNVIDPMDHRNLNVELPEFQDMNPSVENIALVIWNRLQEHVRALGHQQPRLKSVCVHETPKTWAEYNGPAE